MNNRRHRLALILLTVLVALSHAAAAPTPEDQIRSTYRQMAKGFQSKKPELVLADGQQPPLGTEQTPPQVWRRPPDDGSPRSPSSWAGRPPCPWPRSSSW